MAGPSRRQSGPRRTFHYDDPENTWFGDLRVFNDDTLIPGAVWPTHPHRDIEGITYVAEGSFEHADSKGNGGILPRGWVQRATLGSGMEHSEGNHSRTESMRFIQMWIIPSERGLEPSIEQRTFTAEGREGHWLPVLVPAEGYGSPDSPTNPDAVTVHQDAAVYATLLSPSQAINHRFRARFQGYLFVVHGTAHVATDSDAGELDEGGAAKVTGEIEVSVRARNDGAELLLVETRAVDRSSSTLRDREDGGVRAAAAQGRGARGQLSDRPSRAPRKEQSSDGSASPPHGAA